MKKIAFVLCAFLALSACQNNSSGTGTPGASFDTTQIIGVWELTDLIAEKWSIDAHE